MPLDFERAFDYGKQKHRLTHPARAAELNCRRFGFEREVHVCCGGNAAECAQLDSLSRRNQFTQFFGSEEELFRRERDVVGFVNLAITLRQSLVKLAEVRFD